ncbi:bifunctional hydroxymethylpyrimidine kinase/phosphomethylpyrimidine kinase [Xanthomonas campestris pv. campestris]|uniref:hydroxymethylpyrimidine kinase n=4 Tax=Xanthomonas campestris TaxID=339 RepID=Q8P9W2_XANCP|nr:phosphomethylpyrimidine kinase [Xanthomonas campestris pv. campestris str. ATCC 33913]AAY49549.1 phosphomethylpyrimidine kinase [Xanthomonas campestris pv. campestris str. 8004]QCX67968.1 bifunctional hydroxymethylpyrimidine kinase/phosphomethylpyrimidine kinase [Xanthomonas campestris pv. campestris]QCX71535.1 bifunctional hydroxymethylpyrimidine kinase/phosphomethylpyrimidine kinase [Xanthomonas campestris pv. campestris]RFF48688.1 bifunctional hydroxymethylpyrimidine kinase/phosphomethylp
MQNRRMTTPSTLSALTIAGSDSGGGAGIQADLKTFAAHRVHGLSAITALTAQHTRGVTAVHVPPLAFLRAQVDACFADFQIQAVKLGMLANAEVIHCVADLLEQYRPPFVVLDPVMVATSGARLLEDAALDALRTRLLPLANLITPNTPEAELLTGRRIDTPDAADHATAALLELGANAVLLKGGHLREGTRVIDRFDDGVAQEIFMHPRLELDTHGTGCTLSAAIAAQLCQGLSLLNACEAAIDYVARAIANGQRPGQSDVVVLDHFGAAPHAWD